MKITIKLDKRKTGLTSDGYPIVIYISQNYKSKPYRTGFYSKITDWNIQLAEPKQKHPDYYLVSDSLEVFKERIKSILKKSLVRVISIDEAHLMVFKKSFKGFYEAAVDFLPDINNYNDTKASAVKSFDKKYPGILIEEITIDDVLAYKKQCLVKQKPAGVDSYLRSLRSIFNKVTDLPNPFSRIQVQIPKKVNTVATLGDLWVLDDVMLSYRGKIGGSGRYRDYFLLMFYLGGIDPEVLARLRYDENVIDGRIVFNRQKGGSNVACSNIIPKQAYEILKNYKNSPYLVPIYLSKNYTEFQKNFNTRFKDVCDNLELSKKLHPKTPRYTFADRAQELLIDERITAQIVGHERKTTTSLYPNDFPRSVQDEAHLKIISF